MIYLIGKIVFVFCLSYVLSFYKKKLERFFYKTNDVDFIDDNLVKKLNIAIISLSLVLVFLFQTDYDMGTINNIETLKNSPFGFFEMLFILLSIIVFSIFYGLWLLDMILFILSLPFQYVSFRMRKKFLINTKKKKGVLGFFFNFENPKKA